MRSGFISNNNNNNNNDNDNDNDNKALHGQFERATEQVKSKESWNWLTRGDLKKQTEGTIMAA